MVQDLGFVKPSRYSDFKYEPVHATGGHGEFSQKLVDDRHPQDRQRVIAKCADGSTFIGFCIYPYSDCGSIKNWYVQPTPTDWYRVDKKVVQYHELTEEGELQ